MLVMLQINMQKKWSRMVVVLCVFILQIIAYSILFSFQQVNNFIIHYITFPISGFVARITNTVSFPVGEIFYLFCLSLHFLLSAMSRLHSLHWKLQLLF